MNFHHNTNPLTPGAGSQVCRCSRQRRGRTRWGWGMSPHTRSCSPRPHTRLRSSRWRYTWRCRNPRPGYSAKEAGPSGCSGWNLKGLISRGLEKYHLHFELGWTGLNLDPDQLNEKEPASENLALTCSISILKCSPDWLLAAVALALAVADAAGLAQGDAGGGAGPLTQSAPEARAGDGHHRGHGQEEGEAGHVNTWRVYWRLWAWESWLLLLVVNNWNWDWKVNTMETELVTGSEPWLRGQRGEITGQSQPVMECWFKKTICSFLIYI